MARTSSLQDATLLVPKWSAQFPGEAAPVQVVLPAHFDRALPSEPTSYLLRAHVDLPATMRGSPLTLAIPHMPAMATLRVDGVEAVPIGEGEFDVYRATNPHRWRVPASATEDGELSLELEVQHRMSRSAYVDGVPVLTTHPEGGAWLSRVHTFDSVTAVGALASDVVVALLYGILFASLTGRRRASYGWFALGATCGLAYPAFLLGLTQPVFGVYDAPVMTFALTLGSIAAMYFSRAYVDARAYAPSKAWWIVLAAVAVVALVAHDPFRSILIVGPLATAVTLATAVAQIAFIAKLRRSRQPHDRSVYAIALAWPATVVLAAPDIAAWLGQGEATGGVRTACVGIMGLALYQAAALSREHLISLKHADELNEELAARVKLLQSKHREVEVLNDELRRQIAARSRELADKLTSMDEEEIPAEPPALEAGAVVEGRYRIVSPIGAGGMGAVYEVERVSDEKHFALKALSQGGDRQSRARFAREAQICANVSHPNVVSIVDVDVASTGYVFLVMELVQGGTTLHDVRRRHRDIPWTLGVLAQVAEGISAIHEAGIIHRDLKPGNILLSRGADGRRPLVKITDFGISTLQPDGARSAPSVAVRPVMDSLPPAEEGAPSASTILLDLEYDPDAVADTAADIPVDVEPSTKVSSGTSPSTGRKARGSSESPLTETGIIFGTPQYMAQELTAGTRHATRASDVFSLGIIAFELLTGKRPFSEAPVSAKLAGRPLPPLPGFRKYCPTLDAEIAALLDRAMSHAAEERPTAAQLASALRAAADRLSG